MSGRDFAQVHLAPLLRAEALYLLGEISVGFVVCAQDGMTTRRPGIHAGRARRGRHPHPHDARTGGVVGKCPAGHVCGRERGRDDRQGLARHRRRSCGGHRGPRWRYESRLDLGILALSGSLGIKGAPRLHGAIGWTLYHGTGPLIMDLTAVTGWTTLGQGEIIRTVLRLAKAGRTLEIAAASGPVPAFIAGGGQPAIRVHTDLAAALTAHDAPAEPAGEFREWRSDGWPHPSTRI